MIERRPTCRIIPLNETATWALKELLKRAQWLKASESERYLFPAFRYRHTKENTPIGAGYDPTRRMVSWRSSWRTLTIKAGLKGLRFHDLRHHSITELAEVPEQTLKAIASHVSQEMLEHYSHVRMQAKRTAVEALNTLKVAVSGRTNIKANFQSCQIMYRPIQNNRSRLLSFGRGTLRLHTASWWRCAAFSTQPVSVRQE